MCVCSPLLIGFLTCIMCRNGKYLIQVKSSFQNHPVAMIIIFLCNDIRNMLKKKIISSFYANKSLSTQVVMSIDCFSLHLFFFFYSLVSLNFITIFYEGKPQNKTSFVMIFNHNF